MLIPDGPNLASKPSWHAILPFGLNGDGMNERILFLRMVSSLQKQICETNEWLLENWRLGSSFWRNRSGSQTSTERLKSFEFGFFFYLLRLGIRTLLGKGPTRSQYESIAVFLKCSILMSQAGDNWLSLRRDWAAYTKLCNMADDWNL